MRGHEYPAKRKAGWWLRNPRYLGFQLRELGGVLTAVYGVILLNMLVQLRAGESAYEAFLDQMRTPPVLYVNLFTARPIPWKVAFAINILLWIGVSGAVVYLVFGGV